MSIVITTLDHLPEFCDNCPCYHIGYCKADKEHRESYGYRPQKQKDDFESYNIIATITN